MNGSTLDEMRGVLAQSLAFVQRLVDQPDLALLQVAQPTVDQLGALRRGARGEVVALDQRRAQPARGGVEATPTPVIPPPTTSTSNGSSLQSLEHRRAIERGSGHQSDARAGHRRACQWGRTIVHHRVARPRRPSLTASVAWWTSDHHLRPEACRLSRRSGCPRRDDPGVRRVRRLPPVPDVVHVVPITVRDARRPRRGVGSGCRPAHAGATGPGRRRVLPVPALPLQLPVRPRLARAGDRLPASDGTGPPRCVMPLGSGRSGRWRPINCSVAPNSWARWRLAPRRRSTGSVGTKTGTLRRRLLAQVTGVTARRRLAPFAAATVLDVAAEATAARRTRTGSPCHGVPHMPRRVPAPGDRRRSRQRLQSQGHRVRRSPDRDVAAHRG